MQAPLLSSCACAVLVVASAHAQDPNQEISRLQQRLEEIRAETDQALDDLDNRLGESRAAAESSKSGTTGFLLSGYAFAGFENAEGEDSTFGAGFNPIFLWKLSDRLFFEAELEFELEDNETEVGLEYSQLVFAATDHLAIGAGKFLNPANYFVERLHPLWINKLPDKPLPFAGPNALQAPSYLGAQARGGIPVGDTRFEYAVFVSNGPTLRTDDSGGDDPGTLEFKNYSDQNNSKGVGGRIGFFPVDEFEIGYAFEWAKVSPSGFSSDVDAITQTLDANYVSEIDALSGTLDARFQAVWSVIDDATYTLTSGSPLTYDNRRSGLYVQLAYRPTQVEDEILSNLEAVFRYDSLDLPSGSTTPVDQQRFTLGLNYWIGPSTVGKIAFEIDDMDDPTGAAQDQNVFLLQVAMGF